METIQFEYFNLIAAYMLHALVESQSMGKLLYAFKNVRNMEKFLEESAADGGGGGGDGDGGGGDAASGQGDEDEGSRGHPACRAAAKAAGGAAQGKAPPAGRKKK